MQCLAAAGYLPERLDLEPALPAWFHRFYRTFGQVNMNFYNLDRSLIQPPLIIFTLTVNKSKSLCIYIIMNSRKSQCTFVLCLLRPLISVLLIYIRQDYPCDIVGSNSMFDDRALYDIIHVF